MRRTTSGAQKVRGKIAPLVHQIHLVFRCYLDEIDVACGDITLPPRFTCARVVRIQSRRLTAERDDGAGAREEGREAEVGRGEDENLCGGVC